MTRAETVVQRRCRDADPRGFHGRRTEGPADRVPPGQYVTDDFPVLSAGPTPHTPLESWGFDLGGAVDEPRSWSWQELRSLPHETVTVDIHCVTKWSKLDTVWTGVSVDTLLEGVQTTAEYVVARSDGGYTTNLPLADVMDGKAWVAFGYDGAPLDPEHGGPARLLVPHLYFWKSATWVRGIELTQEDEPRLRGRSYGYSNCITQIRGGSGYGRLNRPRLAWELASVVDLAVETPNVTSVVLDVPGRWPYRAGQHIDVRLTAEDGYQARSALLLASRRWPPRIPRLMLTVERLKRWSRCSPSPHRMRRFRTSAIVARACEVPASEGTSSRTSRLGGPLLLIGGGSGIVPLRSRFAAASPGSAGRLARSPSAFSTRRGRLPR